jgi:hypothetical protein
MAVQKLYLLPVMQDGSPKVIYLLPVMQDGAWWFKSYNCCQCCKMAVQKLYLFPMIQDGGPKVLSVASAAR